MSVERSKTLPHGIPRANDLHWNRELWEDACYGQAQYKHDKELPKMLRQYKEIYIGHTSLFLMKPVNACNVWNLDTGAGWDGKLTIMDVDTKEYWQSDYVKMLYPMDKKEKRND